MYSLFCIFTIIIISTSISICSVSYYTAFISTHKFYFLSTSPPRPAEEKGGVSERLSST